MYPAIKILLVDDEAPILTMMTHVLELEGYDVHTANSPLIALEMLRKEKHHIVVTDISMPEMDGLELLQAIRAFDPLIQVVVMTGQSSMQKAIRALEHGATEYLLKPFTDVNKLIQAVKLCEEKLHRWWDRIRETVEKKKDQV